MNSKSMMMLVLAVVCGLGAMYGTSLLISKEKGHSPVDLQDVLVAARDVKVEEVLRPDMVKVVQRSRSDIPAGTFTSIKDVEDRWVQIKTLEGEPILDRKLAPKGSPAGLISRIPKGMRAYAIEVNEQSGVSGFIMPDHRVDVVQVESSADGRSEAETVLQDVLVLASGQTFSRPDDRSIMARTVTLAVSPDQVNSLVAARVKGPLTLSLRGLNDRLQHDRKKVEKPSQVALKGETPPAPPPPPPPPPASTATVVETSPQPSAGPANPRFLTIYKGMERREKVNLHKPRGTGEDSQDSTADNQ